MSDIPTKTYPPSFLHALIADHEAEQAVATPEESSAVTTTKRHDQSEQTLDMVANCKATLTSSRPDDETIWRETWLLCARDYVTTAKCAEWADQMLAEYRKRWPR